MKSCEHCHEPHDGLYGSGRFCSSKCARGFSTAADRATINERVSQKLKKSIIDPHGTVAFMNFVSEATSWSNLAKRMGLVAMGNVILYVQRRAALLHADTSHFKRPKTIEEVLCIRRGEPKGHLREALLKTGRSHICERCGLGSEWCGVHLTLQVDHKNGDKEDHRPENLRFLCPNCHSQTPTHSWKNTRKRRGLPSAHGRGSGLGRESDGHRPR